MNVTWHPRLIALLALLSGHAVLAAESTSGKSQQYVAAITAAAKSHAARETAEPSNWIQTERERRTKAIVDSLGRGARSHQAWEAPKTCQSDPLSARRDLCGLRWRKNDAFSSAKAAVDEMSHKTKARFVGGKWAQHLEVDGDGVRMEFAW